jgi:hypothetical protein
MEFNSVHIAHGEHCSFFWFPLIYIGFGLGEGGDFHHKCSCGEPNFD